MKESELVDWLKQVAHDYHRDFKHPDGGEWGDCPAPRCGRFRALISEFPSVLADDLAKTTERLRALNERASRVLAERAALHGVDK